MVFEDPSLSTKVAIGRDAHVVSNTNTAQQGIFCGPSKRVAYILPTQCALWKKATPPYRSVEEQYYHTLCLCVQ